jgi:hypothetical protein
MLRGVLLMLVMLCLVAAVALADQKQEDWKRMDTLVTAAKEFDSQYALKSDPHAYAEKWFKFIAAWNEDAPRFFATYGKTDHEIKKAFEGVQRPDGTRNSHDPNSLAWSALAVDIPGRQQVIAEYAEELGQEYLDRIEQSRVHSPDKVEFRLKLANQAAVVYNLAETLAPGSSSGQLAHAEKLIAEHEAANLEAVARTTWPGHNQSFQGPGDPDELATAALAFLRNNPDWTRPEYADEHIPYAAVVRGQAWEVEKTVILTGEPTQYALDMLVAFKGKQQTDKAYVYQMVFYTGEARGIERGLPFRFANSRQYAKHQMLLKNVPTP